MQSHIARWGIAAATTVALGATLVACAGEQSEAENSASGLTEVTLMLNWVPNAHHAGIFLAKEAGLYEEAGIDLTIIEPGADVGATVTVAEAKVEFGIAQAESVLPAREGGMPVTTIASLVPRNDSVLMGLRSSGLTEDPATLVGRTYGGYGGALETEIISELVQCAGGNPEEVEFVDIGDVDYLAGLEQQRFDATWVFGGWDALRAEMMNDDVVQIRFDEHQACIPDWYTPVIITNEAFAEKNPELVRAFLEATTEGYNRVIADPAKGADAVLAAAPELDADLMHAAVDYYQPRYTLEGASWGFMEQAVWQRFGDFLVQAGMIADASVVDGAWTNDYLPAE